MHINFIDFIHQKLMISLINLSKGRVDINTEGSSYLGVSCTIATKDGVSITQSTRLYFHNQSFFLRSYIQASINPTSIASSSSTPFFGYSSNFLQCLEHDVCITKAFLSQLGLGTLAEQPEGKKNGLCNISWPVSGL